MQDELIEVPPAVPPLAPGDDDPRSPAVESMGPVSGPLGPGDDDPRSLPKIVGPDTSRAPLGPGESDGANADESFHFLAPPALGPGDTGTSRVLVRIPKAPPSPVTDERMRSPRTAREKE